MSQSQERGGQIAGTANIAERLENIEAKLAECLEILRRLAGGEDAGGRGLGR